MKNKQLKALESIISEFEVSFDSNANFNTKVTDYLDGNEDHWADIMEAKDDLEDATTIGSSADGEKKALANAFAAVAKNVFSKDELKASFPESRKTLSKVDAAALGGDVEKLSIALDI